jgi:hypothetical protein
LLPDGRVLVVGGQRGSCAYRSGGCTIEIWDPATESFSPAGWGRSGPIDALFLVDGRVLAVAPFGGVDRWDPISGSFDRIGRFSNPHYQGTATPLADGRVLVIGGWYTGLEAEVFDPDSGSSSPAGELIGQGVNLLGPTATLLRDGRVLVAGGSTESGQPLAAQVWDPASASFTLTGSLAEGRLGGHSATLLADGRVLIVGGGATCANVFQCSPLALATAEIWNPATGLFTPAAAEAEGSQ